MKARVANYGLMDQVAALHWVQQNIALFGGDPGSVTLMGHGTGAACIHLLIMSPTVMPGKRGNGLTNKCDAHKKKNHSVNIRICI